MRASKAGRGIRLTADDVWLLSQDDAIVSRAANDDERDRNYEIYDAWDMFSSVHTMRERIYWHGRLVELGEDMSRVII